MRDQGISKHRAEGIVGAKHASPLLQANTVTKTEIIKTLIKKYKGRFSVELGIDLSSRKPEEIFKWFLAAVLFGARISGTIAIKTYREFEKQEILTPEAILDTDWDGLVAVLDKSGYTRYDFKTATKLLDMSKALLDRYQGNLHTLHDLTSDPADMEQKLKSLSKGIGDLTVNIFLREMRSIWKKAGSLPVELVIKTAQSMGIVPKDVTNRRKMLALLQRAWNDAGMKAKDFPDFEAALVRAGKDMRRKHRGIEESDKRR